MRRGPRAAAATLLGIALWALTAPVAAGAAPPWWQRAGLAGVALTDVQAQGRTVLVRTGAGETLRSGDSGLTFAAVAGNPPLEPLAGVMSGRDRWLIDASGHVLHAAGGGAPEPDPNAPPLGASAHLIAAPAALPGIVVAVSSGGTVWRRAAAGDWSPALVLLPTGFPGGVPQVTGVAAFDAPLSVAVYLSTDGYSVLDSTDGGDDWIRAGPGLPDSVRGLSADSAARVVFAATGDGLWVHRLRALPAPPVYQDAALAWRWAGIVLIALLSAAAAAAVLGLSVRPPRPA